MSHRTVRPSPNMQIPKRNELRIKDQRKERKKKRLQNIEIAVPKSPKTQKISKSIQLQRNRENYAQV